MGVKRVKPTSKASKRVRKRVPARSVRKSPNLEKLTQALADATEARAHQAATAEILKVIANSPSDVRPVFDAIADAAGRIFGDRGVGLWLVQGDRLRLAARGLAGSRGRDARPDLGGDETAIDRGSAVGCAVLDRVTLQVEDILSVGDELSRSRALAKKYKYRAALCAPLLRSGDAIGALAVMREVPGAFSAEEVELLQTFADQAVIAIENARLFTETKGALERQTATAEILKVISNSPTDVQPVLDAIAQSAARLFECNTAIQMLEDGRIHLRAIAGFPEDKLEAVQNLYPLPLDPEHNIVSRSIALGRIVDLHDTEAPEAPSGATALGRSAGFRAVSVVPLLREGSAIGGLSLTWRTPVPGLSDKQRALLRTFADQAVIAIENVRLFHELEDKSAQIEAVNRHKSEFLANMSHELRTPLNAILGFSEVLGERYFGELNEKQDEYVRDIRGSGEHLLSLINDILDLSKVEAGKMELEPSDFDLPTTLENVATLVRERAQRHSIALKVDLAPGLGAIRADERKLKQIMLNLLSNAVKFTPDGGAITVAAKPVGQMVEVAVHDTGAGIAPEDQPMVFEEFKQVGSDTARRAEGTGLGLPLAKKFVELHGGEIRVKSKPGAGSTFRFTLSVA